MKLNNKGFALTSMIYMLIVLFLMIMLLVLSNLAQRKVVLDKITYDIKNKLDQGVTINVAKLPYQNETTGIYYETLQLAITRATSGDTIKVLKNVVDQSTPSVPQGKEIKIDIAGKEVTLSQMITNAGTLDIYTSEPGGIIHNSNQKTITNTSTGTLTINDTDDTNTLSIINTTLSSGSRVFVNSGNLTINNANIEVENSPSPSSNADSYLISNSNRVEVNNSTLTNVTRDITNDIGIINASGYSNARIIFNSGMIRTSGYAIYNNGGTSSSFDDPVIEINGGTIKSVKTYAIREVKAGAYDIINGGEIFNETPSSIIAAVYMNGNLKVTDGTLHGYNGAAIDFYGNSDSIILGGTISKEKNPMKDAWVSGALINTNGNSNLSISGDSIIKNESGNASNVLFHSSTGTMMIDGNATIENEGSVTTMTLNSFGKILIKGGKVKSNGAQVIINSKSGGTSSSYGTIEVTGGTVETTGTNAINSNSAYGRVIIGTQDADSNTYPQIKGRIKGNLTTSGDIVINSGTITGTTSEGVATYNKVIINGGNISSTASNAVATSGTTGGEIEINGGTITSTSSAVYTNAGTITIGDSSFGVPSITNPTITSGNYGVEAGSGTFNFYGGTITGAIGKAINRNPDNTISGYPVDRTNYTSTETAIRKGTYIVNIEPNGGVYDGQTTTQGYAANLASQINLVTPIKAGYTFGGWVPVKDDYDATWVELYYHDSQEGTDLFNQNDWNGVLLADTAYKYSILGQLEKFRSDTTQPFEFLLEYDEIANKYNRWQQTGNPTTLTIADGASTSSIGYSTSFTGSHIDWNGNAWNGLARSSRTNVFIDGAPGNSGWWYALGSAAAYQGGIPGPNSTVVKHGVHLWVKANANLSNITQQVTGVTNNNVYTTKHNVTLRAIWLPN